MFGPIVVVGSILIALGMLVITDVRMRKQTGTGYWQMLRRDLRRDDAPPEMSRKQIKRSEQPEWDRLVPGMTSRETQDFNFLALTCKHSDPADPPHASEYAEVTDVAESQDDYDEAKYAMQFVLFLMVFIGFRLPRRKLNVTENHNLNDDNELAPMRTAANSLIRPVTRAMDIGEYNNLRPWQLLHIPYLIATAPDGTLCPVFRSFLAVHYNQIIGLYYLYCDHLRPRRFRRIAPSAAAIKWLDVNFGEHPRHREPQD